MTDSCPLCGASGASHYHSDRRRSYWRCGRCALVFVAAAERLGQEEERAEYCRHRNCMSDPGYRRFLSRLADPLLTRLTPAARGLDFGCGPAPLLAQILIEQGHHVGLHDSMFRPAEHYLQEHFDFVTASEVVEHLHRVGADLARLWRCVTPGGWLAVMTKLVRDRESFSSWHYIRDPTHVCFFSRETWSWWAEQQGVQAEFEGADVVLFQKPRD